MQYLVILFAGLTLFTLNGCSSNPANYRTQRIDAPIDETKHITVNDWQGQNICVQLTMDEPVFGNSSEPEIYLHVKNSKHSRVAKIGLMKVSRKNGTSSLFFEQLQEPSVSQQLHFLPYGLKWPASFKLQFPDRKTLIVSARYWSAQTFTFPDDLVELELAATSATGTFHYILDC